MILSDREIRAALSRGALRITPDPPAAPPRAAPRRAAWARLSRTDTVTVGMTTTTTRYAYDGWNPAKAGATGTSNFDVWAVFNSLGSLTSRQLQGDGIDQHLAYVQSSNAYWYLTDHLGSTRAVINNSGAVQDSFVYDAYGNITYQTPSPSTTPLYSYTGREVDVETGLQYNRARWYDSATGRWISQDPLGFDAGDSDLYRYVSNQPTIGVDASGLEERQWQFFGRTIKMVYNVMKEKAIVIFRDLDGEHIQYAAERVAPTTYKFRSRELTEAKNGSYYKISDDEKQVLTFDRAASITGLNVTIETFTKGSKHLPETRFYWAQGYKLETNTYDKKGGLVENVTTSGWDTSKAWQEDKAFPNKDPHQVADDFHTLTDGPSLLVSPSPSPYKISYQDGWVVVNYEAPPLTSKRVSRYAFSTYLVDRDVGHKVGKLDWSFNASADLYNNAFDVNAVSVEWVPMFHYGFMSPGEWVPDKFGVQMFIPTPGLLGKAGSPQGVPQHPRTHDNASGGYGFRPPY